RGTGPSDWCGPSYRCIRKWRKAFVSLIPHSQGTRIHAAERRTSGKDRKPARRFGIHVIQGKEFILTTIAAHPQKHDAEGRFIGSRCRGKFLANIRLLE